MAHSFSVEWSEADGEFVGLVDSYPSLSWLDKNPMVALQGIKDATAEVDTDRALEQGYGLLADDPDLKSIRREVHRQRQIEIELAQARLEDPAEDYSWVGYETGPRVHGSMSKRFSRQDYWVFIGCVVVIAWILLGPVF